LATLLPRSVVIASVAEYIADAYFPFVEGHRFQSLP
jgi:hypothetical protein